MQKTVKDFVEMWENRCYSNGIPDDVPIEIFNKAPSYRLIAKAILSNDVSGLGIEKKPCRAYIELKRLELSKRPGFEKKNQLELF